MADQELPLVSTATLYNILLAQGKFRIRSTVSSKGLLLSYNKVNIVSQGPPGYMIDKYFVANNSFVKRAIAKKLA
jgi:hypothetical protein